MKNSVYAGLTLAVLLSGASVAFADTFSDPGAPTTPLPFSVKCEPYTLPFVEAGAYAPSGSLCIFTLPQVGDFKTVGIYKGTPGNSIPVQFGFTQGNPATILSQTGYSFGSPTPGDQYFAAAYSGDIGTVSGIHGFLQSDGGNPVNPDWDLTVRNWVWATPPPELVVTASDITIPVGSALPSFGVTFSGFIDSDTASSNDIAGSANCITTATDGNTAGDYPITCTVGSLTSSKYIFTSFVPGTLHITDVPPTSPLTVTADDKSMVYGAAMPVFTAQLSGFVNGDTATSNDITGSFDCSSTATASSPVGTYPISCTVGNLTSVDYTFDTFVAGTLTITKAPLTVVAEDANMSLLSPFPPFTYTFSGFVNDDTLLANDITGAASCTSTATLSSPVGDYIITCGVGTLQSDNYNFAAFTPAVLHVTDTQAPSVTITSPEQDATYFKNDTVYATATATDNSAIGSMVYQFNGTTINPADPLPLTSAPAGTTTATLVVTATDTSGNKGYATTTFKIAPADLNPPKITITSPRKYEIFARAESLTITATVEDQSPIVSTTYWMNGVKVNPLTISLSSAPFIDKVQVSAKDKFGNTATSSVLFFVVKNKSNCLVDAITILALMAFDRTYPDKPTLQQLVADCKILLKDSKYYHNY